MRALLTVVLFLVVGCQGGPPSTPTLTPARDVPAPVPAASDPADSGGDAAVALRFDETVWYGHLRIRLLELNDSRCPRGVECVWTGEVVAFLEVSAEEMMAQKLELVFRTGVEPTAGTAGDHEFRLLDVEPYPRYEVTTERGEHRITLEIKALSERAPKER